MNRISKFLKRNGAILLLFTGLGIYVIVAGVTRSCPSCTFVTDLVGLTSEENTAMLQNRDSVEWETKTLKGQTLSSESLKGKVVLVDFWATWCPPCQKEIPGFVELQDKYQSEGLVIVGISMDRDGPPVVRDFADKYRIQYPLAMADASVLEAFGGVRALPTTFLIDRDGRIVSRHVGYTDKTVFESEIKSLLEK